MRRALVVAFAGAAAVDGAELRVPEPGADCGTGSGGTEICTLGAAITAANQRPGTT